MQLEWELKENKPFEAGINALTESSILSQILANRGIDTVDKVKLFLDPKSYPICSPSNFLDLDKAVDRISQSIEKQENIVICGDFDCDGVTSTAVLYKTLLKIGAKVGCYIPNRLSENHGLNSKAIIEIISKQQAKLIVTVDNGISNIAEIKLAKSLGTDVIITDHHEPAEELPNACAILNPKCAGKLKEDLSFNEIENMVGFAGVMVSYKLSCALLDKFNQSDFKEELLPYVMLGTISDVMPLVNENRTIVAKGLDILRDKQPYWLKKLFELAQRSLDKIESETMAFTVAPRINAAGRLEHATTALECIVSDDKEKVDFCANQLHQFNLTRQQMCETSFNEAKSRISNEIDLKTTKAIVLADEKWHIGIVGLLASKIVEAYNRPAFIMNIDKEENLARCSIRGIKGLNIHKVLTELEDCFINYGGHELAGGFGADLNKISVKELSRRINSVVSSHLEGNSLKQRVQIDAIINPEDLTLDFIDKLSILEPYGEGNRSCVFGMENMTLKKFDVIGNNSHLKMLFESPDKQFVFEGLIWNKNEHAIELLDVADLTFVPKINVFKDKKTIQLMIKNIYIKNREIEVQNNDFDENAKIQALLVDHRKKTDFFKMLNSYLNNNSAEVFLENKEISNIVADYLEIKKCVKNRFNLEKCDELILLSSPCSEEDFSKIIKDTSPSKVHIFNGKDKKIDVNEFIKTISGMLRYSSTHYNGEIEIGKSLAYLSATFEAFNTCLELLNDANVINIINKTEDTYTFEFLQSKPLTELLDNDKYKELLDEVEKINSFKEDFQTCDIAQVKEMIEI